MAIFRCAHASDADWESAARSCLLQLDSSAQRGDLGFIYVTDPLASRLGDIVRFLRLRTGVQSWVGSVGAGVCAPGTEYHGEPALSVLVAALPPGSFRVFCATASMPSTRSTARGVERQARGSASCTATRATARSVI